MSEQKENKQADPLPDGWTEQDEIGFQHWKKAAEGYYEELFATYRRYQKQGMYIMVAIEKKYSHPHNRTHWIELGRP